jgi:3-vinyl bacteriochlorophyllide hydratase
MPYAATKTRTLVGHAGSMPSRGGMGASHQTGPRLSIEPDDRRPDDRTAGPAPLYTLEQRRRRDETPWTLVQGILAPVQFLVFLISLGLVVHFLLTGRGLALATGSVVVKTLALYAIMITGSIWEKVVFGRYLFAPAFFWEDVFSMLVLALHTAYLAALATDRLGPHGLMLLALAAYATYVVNAGQFILKLRAARRQAPAGLRLVEAA